MINATVTMALIAVIAFAVGIVCGCIIERIRANAAYVDESRLCVRQMTVLSDTDVANLWREHSGLPPSGLH
jgi:uncharacterized membrane-anchored protein YhcB (DUF1043 family)